MNPDDARALSLGAMASVQQGKRDQGLEWARRALTIDPEDSGMLYNSACLFAVQGEREQALDCLEKAVNLGFGLRDWIANDPDLVPLHGHPRFQALLTKL